MLTCPIKGMFLVFVWGVSVMWRDNPTSCMFTHPSVHIFYFFLFFFSSPFYEMRFRRELSDKIIIWVGQGNNAKGQQLRQNP